MDAITKQKLDELVSAYCSLTGFDVAEFFESCKKQCDGDEDLLAQFIVNTIKNDASTMRFVEEFAMCSNWQRQDIATADKSSRVIQGQLAYDEFDEQLIALAFCELEKNKK